MGLFGHGGWLSQVGHGIEHTIDHTLDHYDQILRSHGAPDIYIGGTYGANGFTPNIQVTPQTNPGYTQNPQINKPVAYTANAAKTASSIAQGGMTKQEIQDFNAKHPNESAWRQS